MTCRWLPIPLSIAIVSAAVAQGSDAQRAADLIRAYINNQSKTRFHGEREVTFSGPKGSQSHVEVIRKDGVRVRVDFPAGSPFEGQIIVENGKERRHYLPARNEIRIQPVRSDRFVQRLKRLIQSSDVSRLTVTDGGEVAGMPTQMVEFRGQREPGFKLWIEPKSKLIVKRQIYGPNQEIIGGYTFRTLNFKPSFGGIDFGLSVPGAKTTRPSDELARAASKLGLPALQLDRSTKFTLEFVRTPERKEAKVIIQGYFRADDVQVTLFILGQDVNPEMLKRFARGPVKTYAWKVSGVQCVLTGEVGEEELQRLSTQVKA
jgi:hypothetical protein